MSPDAVTSWSSARWARVLDRIDHRCVDVGLRFWAPPLWLEVTMSGPDSDLWPSTDGPDQEWNWQSSDACAEATELGEAGATDEQVLAVVSRYALENLVLNAVHEIGEWFRFDGRRVFPSHLETTRPDERGSVDPDGNGTVHLELGFPEHSPSAVARVSEPPANVADRVGTVVAASRFSYLPGTFVSYDRAGPVITGPAGPGCAWHGEWSPEVVDRAGEAAGADLADWLVSAVATDVHRALVGYEADRVCRAFHVDGLLVWAVASGRAANGSVDDLSDRALQPMTISISYTGEGSRTAGSDPARGRPGSP